MNKVLATSLLTGVAILSFSSIASAYEPGWYLGGQLGWTKQYIGQINTSSVIFNNVPFSGTPVSNSNHTSSGLGGALLGGYLFNDYFAGELDYIDFHNVSSSTTVYGQDANNFPLNAGVNASSHMQDLDLLAKAMYPFGDSGFDVFAKAGAAIIFSKLSASAFLTQTNSTDTGTTESSLSLSSKHNPIRPAYGLGFGYDINDNWTTTVTWLRTTGSGSSVPSANIATLGIDYYFGT